MSDALVSARTRAFAGAFVVLIGVLPFLPALSGGFVSDDVSLVVGNARIRSPSSLVELVSTPFWDTSSEVDVAPAYARIHRPLVKLAYHAQLRLFGDEPLGFHGVSLLLHALCVALAFDALRARLGRADAAGLGAAAVGAMLFALHPTRAESVAWISGSTDLWMALFVLLAERAFRDARSAAALVAGGTMVALAGLAKEPGWLAPIVLVADAFARGEARRQVLRVAGASTGGAALAVLAWTLVVPPAADLEGGTDVVLVLATLGHYARLIAWPHPSSFDPALVDVGPDGRPEGLGGPAAAGAVVLAAIAIVCVLAVRRPSLRWWAADALWFVVPLIPVLNLVVRDPSSLVHERFLYLSMFGAASAMARGLAIGIAAGGPARTAVLGASAGVLLACGVATLAHVGHFASNAALTTHELEIHPDRPHAYAAYVDAMRAERAFDEAAEAALAGAALGRARQDPASEAFFLLRWAQTRLDSISDAEQDEILALRAMYDGYLETRRLHFEGAHIRFDVQVPATAPLLDRDTALRAHVLVPRVTAYVRTGALAEAEAQLDALLERTRRAPDLWNLLTLVRARRGDFEGALGASDEAARVLPGSPVLRGVRESVERARALASRPARDAREAAMREAQVQLALGAPETARRALAPALEAAPTDHGLVHLRAQIDVSDRRFDLARATIESARRLAPGDPFFDAELAQLGAAELQASAR